MATDGINSGHPARSGTIAALMAAFFFGMSAPFSKLLLDSVGPVMLASLLYGGSFLGLSLLLAARKRSGNGEHPREAALKIKDIPYLAGSILCGGIAAPIFMVYGLMHTKGSVASLLLNIEGILTAIVASLIFREEVGRRIWLAAAIMFAATTALSWSPDKGIGGFEAGPVLVMLSALMWAFDNNITRKLSHRDPYMISTVKGGTAGGTNFLIALMLGEKLPASNAALGALGLGAVAYGASLVFFIYALRGLGTARTSAYFGAAPFIGAALSIAILGEPVTLRLAASTVLMLAGLWLILREFHEHEHAHHPLCHEHSHFHDDGHHNHSHEEEVAEPHCHEHEHEHIVHTHAHVPDLHHGHRH